MCGTFHQVLVRPWDIPLIFCASTGLSVNLRELYMRPKNLPSTFCCGHRTFHKLPSTFAHSQDLLLTFRATVGPSVTFSQLSVRSRVYLPTFVNFPCVCGTFHQLSMQLRTFRPLSLHPHTLPSANINFPCIRGTFRELTLWQWDLPSNYRVAADILSTFFASAQLSINLRHLSVHPLDLQ